MSSNKKVLTGIGWAYSERLLAQAISLIVSVVLARLLDPEHYGIVAIVLVFINILNAFVTGGFGNALIQKKNADDLDFNTICWFSIACAILLYGFLFLCAPLIAAFYKMEQLTMITRVMGFRVVISAFNSVQHAYVQRHMQFKMFFFSTLGGTLISGVVGVLLAYNGFGVWALAAQYLTNCTIDTIVLLFTIKWKPRLEWSYSRLKRMLPFGLKMLGATMVNTLQDNIRSLVVGKVFSAEDLAFYNEGKKYPATLMNNLVGSIQKVLFPAFSDLQDDREIIKSQMRKAIRISSFILVPIVVGIIAVADTFVVLLLTEKWAPAIPYLRILSLIYLTRTMNSIFQSSLLAIGKSGANMFHEIATSIMSLLLIFIGAFLVRSVPFIAWSYVVVMIFGTAIFIVFVGKSFNYTVNEIMSDYLPFVAASVIMGLCVYFIGKFNIYKMPLLILQICAGGSLYYLLSKLLSFPELGIVQNTLKNLYERFRTGRRSSSSDNSI